MTALRLPLAAACWALLVGFSSVDEDIAKLEKYLVGGGNVGSGVDYWLVKDNAFGEAERVGLIFGYANDASACQDTADILNTRYSMAHFRCAKVGISVSP